MSSNRPQTELAATPAKDDAPRESLIDRIRPFILVFLLLLPFVLVHAFTDYMYVCRIHLPAGTKAVDQTMIPQRSRLGEYLDKLAWTGKHPWIKPYLGYRHCIIPEGAEEILEGAFYESGIRDNLHSVRIPGSVKKIGDDAFASCGKLTDINIPDSVEQMGDRVFLECRGLHRIVIPGSVKKIGNGMFADCAGLSEVVIPDGVKGIGDYAFSDCAVLRTVDIPDSVERIGRGAFYRCRSLEEIRLPAGMARQLTEEEKQRRLSAGSIVPSPVIERETFYCCNHLLRVTLPDGIERIEEEAFRDCFNLGVINLPDSLTAIGVFAFYGPRLLSPLTIGKQLQEIGGGAFTGTRCDLTVPDDHPAFRFEDGILYSKDGSELISCVSPPDGPCVVAPGVKIIRAYAFEKCDGITEIRLPESLEEIGTAAFAGCTGLKHLELPDSLHRIESAAFSGCHGLTGTLAIPPNVMLIGDGAFAFCSGLTELTIPPSVKEIRSGAFGYCANLKHVTFPDSMDTIGDGAFDDCSSLDQETVERLRAMKTMEYSEPDDPFPDE